MLLFDRTVVVGDLKHGSESPEEGEKSAEEFAKGGGPAEVAWKKKADQAKPDEHKNDENRMHGENLANDRRDLGQIVAVMEFGREEEIGSRRDELQNTRDLNGRLKGE